MGELSIGKLFEEKLIRGHIQDRDHFLQAKVAQVKDHEHYL